MIYKEPKNQRVIKEYLAKTLPETHNSVLKTVVRSKVKQKLTCGDWTMNWILICRISID